VLSLRHSLRPKIATMNSQTLLGMSGFLSTLLTLLTHFIYEYVVKDKRVYITIVPLALAIFMSLFQMTYLRLYTRLPTGLLVTALLMMLKAWHWIASGGVLMGVIMNIWRSIANYPTFHVMLHALCLLYALVAVMEYCVLEAILKSTRQQEPGQVALSGSDAEIEHDTVTLPVDVPMASSAPTGRSDHFLLQTSVVLSIILSSQSWLAFPGTLIFGAPSLVTILLGIFQMVYRSLHPHMYPGLPLLALLVVLEGWHWALSGGLLFWILWGSLQLGKDADGMGTWITVFLILWSMPVMIVALLEYRVLSTLVARTRQQRQLRLSGHDAEHGQGPIFLPADRDSNAETELPAET
jgi:hypothetical protein